MENNTSLQQQLLEAGVHFGHLRKKWNPKMSPYIFMEHKGIHIIDLNRTAEMLERSALAMKAMAKSGKKIISIFYIQSINTQNTKFNIKIPIKNRLNIFRGCFFHFLQTSSIFLRL